MQLALECHGSFELRYGLDLAEVCADRARPSRDPAIAILALPMLFCLPTLLALPSRLALPCDC
jgi:hypothetical protein